MSTSYLVWARSKLRISLQINVHIYTYIYTVHQSSNRPIYYPYLSIAESTAGPSTSFLSIRPSHPGLLLLGIPRQVFEPSSSSIIWSLLSNMVITILSNVIVYICLHYLIMILILKDSKRSIIQEQVTSVMVPVCRSPSVSSTAAHPACGYARTCP